MRNMSALRWSRRESDDSELGWPPQAKKKKGINRSG